MTCLVIPEYSLSQPDQGDESLDPLFTVPEVVLLMVFSTWLVLLCATSPCGQPARQCNAR